MKYIHPKRYEGVKLNTPNGQNVIRLRVETYCLKCDKFMGQEHDFSECQTFDKWKNGKIIKHKNCAFDHVTVPLIEPEKYLKCEVQA